MAVRRPNPINPSLTESDPMTDKPDAAFHEKKDKNKKEYNYGKGQKLKMNKAAKHRKPLSRGQKKK